MKLQYHFQMPKSPNGWKQIAQKYEVNTYFRNCIDSLDGRHMIITNPLNAGSTYINYKCSFSVILMGMCDSEYRFTYANIGAQGRISDGGISNNCSLSRKFAQGTLSFPPSECTLCNSYRQCFWFEKKSNGSLPRT